MWQHRLMPITITPYSEDWPRQFTLVAADLHQALVDVSVISIEHVGSTAVPGLAAKPILDIDVVVKREHRQAAIDALVASGYVHRGSLGAQDREAFRAPDDTPQRHVYVCVDGTLHVRNHLAVRTVLRNRPDLRDAYAAVKMELAQDPTIDIGTYISGKSAVLHRVHRLSDLSAAELREIRRLNDDS
jgi:GrpB-like predicted nucleotidyltransferase (UPF0157 family)